ncbi:MAG: metal ABC transporter ATP-binding protein [Thermoguttaceae bacterium]
MTQAPVIEVRNVSFSYQATPVLEEVNLTIYDRESVCIVGPNGGGKTTLLRLLLGQLQPTQGEILIFGDPPEQARSRIGYMPQRSEYDTLFPVTVLDVVLMGRLGQPGVFGWLGWYGASDRRAAREALGQVHMADEASRPFVALSGGQRQRVLIARALCCHPELLLLDEPTANVDSLVEARLFDELHQLGQRMTIVLVSHDLGFVTNLVQRVICVNRRAVAHPASQLTAEVIRDMYGGDVNLVRHGDVMCHREHVHD